MLSEDELASPELVLVESANILRRLELAGKISRVDASDAYSDLLHLNLELFPFAPFAERVWELHDSLTCYDAWYVALAEALDCRLVTLDRRISRASGVGCEVVIPAD